MKKVVIFMLLYITLASNIKYISVPGYSRYFEYPRNNNDTINYNDYGTKYWVVQDTLYIIGTDTANFKYLESYLIYKVKQNDTLTRYDPETYEPQYEIADIYEVQRHGKWTFIKEEPYYSIRVFMYKNDSLVYRESVKERISRKEDLLRLRLMKDKDKE